MFSWLKRLTKKRRSEGQSEEEIALETDLRLSELIIANRNKIKKFLVTRSVEQGELKKTKEWKLIKNNSGLFKLEGENFSLLVSTSPFLSERNGKLTGLIYMSEIALCRILQKRESRSSDFIASSERLSYLDRITASEFFPQAGSTHRAEIEEMIDWDDFDIYQVVSKNSLNTLAHILIQASPPLEKKLRSLLSKRTRQNLILELESFISLGMDTTPPPYSRVRTLLQFELAVNEFQERMGEVQEIKKTKERRGTQR